MAGQLKIVCGTAHSAGRVFVVRIEVSGAQPGDRVTVRLTQTEGTRPYYAGSQPQPVDITASGRGIAEFDDVVLHGPGSTAILVADAEALRSDEAHIQVIP
jgi:hypothetical protein